MTFRKSNTSVRKPVVILLAVLLAITPLGGVAQQPPAPLRQMRLEVIFSASLFPSVNRSDVIAALRMLGSTIGRRRGLILTPSVEVIDKVADIRQRVQAGFSGIVALDTIEWIQLSDVPRLQPALLAGRGDGPTTYLLLVRKDAAITSLADLRGKRLIVNVHTAANLGQVWLNSMLRDARLDSADRHFSSIQLVNKSSSAILPLFFGKADAAIVDEVSFQANRELNPALGTSLRVFSKAPPLAEGIICLSSDVENRTLLYEALRDLNLDTEGRQILMAFRLTRLVPLDSSRLEDVRKYWRKSQASVKVASTN